MEIGDIIGLSSLVILPLMIWGLIKLGVIETPKMTLERKMREADQNAIEIARYRKLSEEGKLLYQLNQKQEKNTEYTRVILGILFGGAVGFLAVHFWPF